MTPANPPSGKYVSQILVNVGTIDITYSNVAPFQANANINADILSIRPMISGANAATAMVTSCGTAARAPRSAWTRPLVARAPMRRR